MKRIIRWMGTAAVVAALPAVPLAVRAAGSDYSGRYECTQVLVGETAVSLTFDLTVVSHGDQDLAGATITLVDASDPGVVYAEFRTLSFSNGVDVPLTATVELDRAEWDRWTNGAPPRVRLEAFGVDGTDLGGMVEVVRISSPEVVGT
jgi:hypothetical protein